MNAHTPAPALGIGLYPLPDAARLAQLDLKTARRWAVGYDYRTHGELRHSPGVMPLTLAAAGRSRDLTFVEMLTLRLVKGFRDARLGLRTIKRVAEVAAAEYQTPLPFVTRRFRTDGRKIFIELQHAPAANEEPDLPRHERELIEVLSGQRAFADIVEPSLFQNVDWAEDIASRWWPLGRGRRVVLDPGTLFGAPHVLDTRVPTETLAAEVKAEGGGETAIEAVAKWYGLPSSAVRDALAFQDSWFRRAA